MLGLCHHHGYTRFVLQIEGVAMFNVCISKMMAYAVDHFRGRLVIEAEVTTADGSTVRVSDASCPVNKHLVDLEFTKDTRRHFKPGLPYRGKVKSGTDWPSVVLC